MAETEDYSFYERFKGDTEGYCRLCGAFAKLTDDHVPPRSCGNDRSLRLQDFPKSDKYQDAKGGLMFRTICERCNTIKLGQELDPLLADFVAEISYKYYTWKVRRYRLATAHIACRPNRILKALVGHLLAGFHQMDQLAVPISRDAGSYLLALRDFWNGSTARLPDTIRIHYWLHPFHSIVFAPQCAFIPDLTGGISVIGSVIKFFPVAFWIADFSGTEIRFNLPEFIHSSEVEETRNIKIDFTAQKPQGFPFQVEPDSAFLMFKNSLYYGMQPPNASSLILRA
jgi:hypothetical protein